MDNLGVAGSVLALIPVITYCRIVRLHYASHNVSTYSLVILSLRAGLILPCFALFTALAIWFPEIFVLLAIPEAIIESISIHCLYALLVKNCGGPGSVVKLILDSDAVDPCCHCQREDPKRCYIRIFNLVWQFVYFHPVVVILQAAAFYFKPELAQLVGAFSGLQTLFMLPALMHLAHILYSECYELNIVYKMFLVKITVGIVTFQAIIEDALVNSDVITMSDSKEDSRFSEEDNLRRLFFKICLGEYLFMTIFLWLGFSKPVVSSPLHIPDAGGGQKFDRNVSLLLADSSLSPYDAHDSNSSIEPEVKVSLFTFLMDIICIWRFPCGPYTTLSEEQSKHGLLHGNHSRYDDKSPLKEADI